MTIKYFTDRVFRFMEMFDDKSGMMIRSNTFDADGNDTGHDPFMRSFPSLIDIGVMGKCSSANTCNVGCYQQGRNNKLGHNMSLEAFKDIVDQIKGKTMQMALGGFGNPNDHPDFEDIVRYARENGVPASYTTAGNSLTPEQVEITKKYCSAVAVSWHNQVYTFKAIDMFLQSGITTNIHFVLGNDSIDEALFRLTYDLFPDGINTVIFLLYKPVGKVKDNNVLHPADPKVKEFYRLLGEKHSFKTGVDSCHVPGLLNFGEDFVPETILSCDAGRFSMYISADGSAMPCSFDSSVREWAVDLTENSIQEVWNGEVFNRFREHNFSSCHTCELAEMCHGGCGLMASQINLCERRERDYVREGN